MRLRAARLRLVTRGTGSYEDPASPPSTLGEWEALESLVSQSIAETGNTQIITFILLQKQTSNYEDPRRILTEERGDRGMRGPGEARVYPVLVCLRSVSALQALLAYFILAGA